MGSAKARVAFVVIGFLLYSYAYNSLGGFDNNGNILLYIGIGLIFLGVSRITAAIAVLCLGCMLILLIPPSLNALGWIIAIAIGLVCYSIFSKSSSSRGGGGYTSYDAPAQQKRVYSSLTNRYYDSEAEKKQAETLFHANAIAQQRGQR